LTSILAGGEWSASHAGRFTPGERPAGTYWIGGCVDPRIGLENMEKGKFLSLPGLELQPLGRPVRSHSLHRRRYPVWILRKAITNYFGDKLLYFRNSCRYRHELTRKGKETVEVSFATLIVIFQLLLALRSLPEENVVLNVNGLGRKAGPSSLPPRSPGLLHATSTYGDLRKTRSTNLRYLSPFESEIHRPWPMSVSKLRLTREEKDYRFDVCGVTS
jgi:hypothetical protein